MGKALSTFSFLLPFPLSLSLSLSLAVSPLAVLPAVFLFQDRVSLCGPGCLGTPFVEQPGLELRDLSASAS